MPAKSMERALAIDCGLKTYKGYPCKNGHEGIRKTHNRQCVECVKETARQPQNLKRARDWRERNLLRDKASKRNWQLLNKYNISQEQYDQMLSKQKSCCGLCGIHVQKTKSKLFVVDHCHKSGKVRSLLCYKCNNGLGQFLDSKELLLAAINYVEKHSG